VESKIHSVPVVKGTLGGRGEVAISRHAYKDVRNQGKRRLLAVNEKGNMSEQGHRDPGRERERERSERRDAAKSEATRDKKDTAGSDERMSVAGWPFWKTLDSCTIMSLRQRFFRSSS